ncbi:unnamed protein product [Protopolystoma xenopodis]|uniref:Protein Wnt n=1 Tax=Protopolystoma xenopodis TaxID=117903 RepID=A0A3S5CI62_9PLAT|nr:unnamed protein product [Protopolystoma xenopodis]
MHLLCVNLHHVSTVHATIHCSGIYRYAREKSRELDHFSEAECVYSSYRYGLRRRQLRFCRDERRRYAMHAALKSAQAVAYYCPRTFRDRRWNCTSISYLPLVTPDLRRGQSLFNSASPPKPLG